MAATHTIAEVTPNISMRDLEVISTNIEEVVQLLQAGSAISAEGVEKLESNVGDVGMAPDYSNNQLATALQNDHPLVTWLLNTPLARTLRATSTRGLASLYKDPDTNDWMLMLPYTVYTLPPASTAGACCWVPFDIAKCAANAPLKLLCLKDCYSLFDKLVNSIRRAGGNDLTNYFLRPGETVMQARRRMARLTMAYMTAKNVVLGVSDAGTDTLKPFHGLLEVMENPAVFYAYGGDVLSAFASLGCRIDVLGGNKQYVFAVNPLVYASIKEAVQPDPYGRLPAGWSRNGDEVYYKGIRFIRDKVMLVDLVAGQGEVWLLEGTTTGAWLATGLVPGPAFINDQFSANDNPDEGCASECTYYWNFGTVANTNPNYLAVITGIPVSTNCAGSLVGLDELINPETPVTYV